ncbi:hypothetical protein R1flu_027088 [Riccia fluitans]|uniref:Uncharacterized protein n=1 Tax=Riccia fluitans TaxID=41844 RepID=A0ABD1XIB8_9MARC
MWTLRRQYLILADGLDANSGTEVETVVDATVGSEHPAESDLRLRWRGRAVRRRNHRRSARLRGHQMVMSLQFARNNCSTISAVQHLSGSRIRRT